jgi:hypothetical protein
MVGKDKCSDKSGLHNDIPEMLQVMNDSMSMMAKQLEGRIDTTAGNMVRWGPVLRWLQLCRAS